MEENMAHTYTTIMNGRDIYRFLDIPREFIDRQILITIEPIEKPNSKAAITLQKLFSDAPKIKIPKKIKIDSLMKEMNDALLFRLSPQTSEVFMFS
jgi:hypothetical protein